MRYLFFLTITIFILSSGNAQITKQDSLKIKIDGYLEETMKRLNIPGFSVVATKDDRIIYSNAFGVRSIETSNPMNTENVFHMASVSKPFVATAIMQLVEKGQMDLDQKLTTYLPYIKMGDDNYKNITIRQMLNHTSGIDDVSDYEWDKPQFDNETAERLVRSLEDWKITFTPGENWAYSNMAFDILADVIAKVAGIPFETYVKKNILTPLGMKVSSFIYPEIPESLRVTPHTWKSGIVASNIYPYNRKHAPSSTLNSNVLEMANWAIANLNKGEFQGQRILKESSYDVLWTNSVNMNKKPKVGLSWFLTDYKGSRVIMHGGGDLGFRSYCMLLPDSDIAIIAASNYERTPIGNISHGILDIILNRKPNIAK